MILWPRLQLDLGKLPACREESPQRPVSLVSNPQLTCVMRCLTAPHNGAQNGVYGASNIATLAITKECDRYLCLSNRDLLLSGSWS
jgi:hypothetical protein